MATREEEKIKKQALAEGIGRSAFSGSLGLDEDEIREQAGQLGITGPNLEAYVRKARDKAGIERVESDRLREQEEDAGKQKEFNSWATGLKNPGEIAEERLLDEQGISALDAGGFGKRDRVRTSINRSVADEKRLKRATNLAYRQRVKFGDLRGALGILKDAKADGVTFGGISPAGETRKNVIAGKGAHLKKWKREVGEGELAPQANAGVRDNPVYNLGQGGTTERATDQLAEGYKPTRRKGVGYPSGGDYLTQRGMA